MANGGQINYSIGFNVQQTELNQLKNTLRELQQMTVKDIARINFDTKDAEGDLERVKASVKELQNALNKSMNADLGTINLTKFNKELKNMDLKSIYQNLSLAGTAGTSAFRNLTTGLLQTNVQIKQSNKFLNDMANTMKNTIKWGVASSVMNSFTSSVQQAYGYVKHLDSSLNDIRIVTGYSADEMDRFAEKANKAAKSLAASTTDYTEAALIYYQQGLAGDEVEKRAETTLKTANVTGQSAAEVSEQLTAVWNGYKVSAQETEVYVDKLAAVAASTASDLEELSTGMSKVASAAATSGVDIDQLSATLSTVISVTRQAPESVGTAFKTIYARLGDLAVDGVDEFGTSLGQISSKMETMGIHILDETGNMRDMGTVVEEVAAKWDTWSSAQKQAAAVAMAGKRQYNNLIALFENWDMYEDSLLTSQNSLGTLAQQQEIYLDSAEAKLQQLKTAQEGVYDSLLDADTIKEVASALTFVVSGFEQLIDGIGGGSTALVGLGAVFTKVFNKQLTSSLTTTALNFQKMKDKANNLQQSTILVNQFKKSLDELGEKADKATRNVVNAYNDMLKASGSLSDEDIQKFNDVVKKYDNAATAMDRYRLAKEKAGSGMAAVTEDTLQEGISDDDWQAIENRAENLQNKGITSETDLKNNNQLYQKFKNEVIETSKALQSQGNDFKANFDVLKRMTSEVKEQKADFSTYEAEIEETRHAMIGFAEELSKNPLIKGTEVQKELDKIVQAMEQLPNEVNDDTEKIEQQLKDAFQEAVTAIKQELGEIDIALDQAATGQSKKIKEQFAAAAADMQEEGTKVNTTLKMQGVVDGIQNVEMLAFGIMATTNAFKVLGDESLTTGEKIGQFTLGIISGLSTLISGISGLATILPIVNTLKTIYIGLTISEGAVEAANIKKKLQAIIVEELLADAINRAEKELTQEEIAFMRNTFATEINTQAKKKNIKQLAQEAFDLKKNNLLHSKRLITLGKYAAIAAIVIAAGVAIHKVITKEERATKKAAEAAQGLNRELERTQQVAADVQSGLDAYSSAVDTLNDLEEGTAKWNQQLITANNEVLSLIEKFPGLAQYTQVGENGLITISPEGEDYLTEQTTEQLKTAQRNSIAGQVNYLKARNAEIQGNATEGTGTDATTIEYAIDKGLREGLGFLEMTTEEMIASGVRADVANAIVENSDVIAQAVTEIEANNVALEMYGEQVSNLALGDDGIFKDLSKGDQALASEAYQNEYDKLYKTEYQKAKSLTKRQVRDEYAEVIGATGSRKGDSKGTSQYLVNGEWTEDIANDTAKIAIASDNASEGLTDFTSGLFEAGEGLLYFKNELLKANDEDVLNGAGYTSRAALTDTQANLLMQMEKGTKYTDLDLSNLSSADLKNMKKGVAGKEDNDYQISQEIANEMGFYGENAVEEYKQHIYDLIVAEQKARTEAEENARKIGMHAIQEGGVVTSNKKAGELYDSVAWEGLAEGINPEEVLGNIDWSQAPDNEADLQKWFGEQAQQGIRDANLDQEIQQEGLDLAEVEEYGKHLQDIAEISDEVADRLKDDPLAAKAIAADAKRASKGIEKLSEVFETYADTLEQGNLTADDWSDAAAGIKEGMADILDLSSEEMGWMDDEFIVNNLENIKKAAEGDVDAIQALWAEAGKQYLIDIDLDIPEDDFNRMNELISQVADEDLEIGASIDDSQYAMGLFNMMTNAGATAEEIQGTFDKIGWEPEVETRTITLSKSDIRKGKVTVPSQISAGADGEITIDHQTLPIDSSLSAGDTFTYTVIKGKGGKGSFTPNMSRKTTASASTPKSSSSGGGGGSTSKKTTKTSEKKRDPFRGVNNSLAKLTTEFDRLAEKQDKLFGKDLLDNLNDQLKVMEKQVSVTKEKLAIAQQEAKEMRSQKYREKNYKDENGYTRYNDLLDFGIKFNDKGEITNYKAKMQAYDDKIASKVAKWNSMTAKQQSKNKSLANEIEALKANRDTLKSLIEKYDELLYTTIPGLVDDITQKAYDQIQLKMEAFQVTVDLRLEVTEARKDMADFYSEWAALKDEDDILGQTKPIWEEFINKEITQGEDGIYSSKNLNTLLGRMDIQKNVWDAVQNGTFDPTKNKDHEKFAAKDLETGEFLKDDKGKYIFDENTFAEKMQENAESVQDYILEMEESFNQIHDAYLDGIDAISDAYTEELEVLEYIGDQLEHNLRITELIKGESAYDDKAVYYENQINNLNKTRDKLQEQINYYKEKIEIEADEEAREKWAELYRQALDDYQSTLEEIAETIQEQFENIVQQQLKELDNFLGGVSGTRKIKSQWEIDTENAEKYLDTVEKTYAIQSLSNKINQSIAETNSISAQTKLNKLKEEELAKLREKDKLTQYDVDRANALYEIELKKIALEEAQNNKSQMRLRRDASGNYSYQFVADQDSTAAAQQELLDAQNSLYSLDKDTMKERQDELWDVYQEYQDLMTEYSQLSAEEREKYEDEYAAKFTNLQQRMTDLGRECSGIQINLAQSASSAMADAYAQMGDQIDYTMEEIIPKWINGMDEMIAKINSPDGSFQAAMEETFASIKLASEQAINDLADVSTEAANAYTAATTEAEKWEESAKATTSELTTQIEELEKLNAQALTLKGYWESIATSSAEAAKNIQDAVTKEKEEDADEIEAEEQGKNTGEEEQPATPAAPVVETPTTSTTSTTTGNTKKTLTDSIKIGIAEAIWRKGGKTSGWGNGDTRKTRINKKFKDSNTKDKVTPYSKVQSYINKLANGSVDYKKKKSKLSDYYYKKFDTGGYTGDWSGTEGKMAMLHKKEMVLNAKDTKNMLEAVKILRQYMDDYNSMADRKTASSSAIAEKISEIYQKDKIDYNKVLIETTEAMVGAINKNLTQLIVPLETILSSSALDLTKEEKSDIINIEINADFPNANSAAEIEKAFLHMTNIATQRAHSTKK